MKPDSERCFVDINVSESGPSYAKVEQVRFSDLFL